jgi:hypothetical protein
MKDAIDRFYRRLGLPIQLWSRWMLGLAIIPLLASFAFPLWNIRMLAPQYPKGLELDIYAHTIVGGNQGNDLNEINTLNHYIGMRKLDRAHFADLDWMPFAIGALALLALRIAAIGDVRSLIDLSVLTLYFLGFSAARFAFQLYEYGHDLDPSAPIEMAPFMPPIFGTQQIANFTTASYPRGATFLLGLFAAIVCGLALWHAWRAARLPVRAPG